MAVPNDETVGWESVWNWSLVWWSSVREAGWCAMYITFGKRDGVSSQLWNISQSRWYPQARCRSDAYAIGIRNCWCGPTDAVVWRFTACEIRVIERGKSLRADVWFNVKQTEKSSSDSEWFEDFEMYDNNIPRACGDDN